MKTSTRGIPTSIGQALGIAVLVPAFAWAVPDLGDDPVGDVTGVQIRADDGETVVAVDADRGISARQFVLGDPPRLVVDLGGARHALPRRSFSGIGRGGVVGLTSSQFQSDVVRLVVELTAEPEYTRLEREGGTLEVRFPNRGGAFDPWSSEAGGGAGPAAAGANGPDAEAARVDLQEAQPRISETYDSASMLDVLAGFSEFSGMSIVPGSDVAEMTVRGVSVNDQPWDVALDAILSAHGLGWRESGEGIIVVNDLEELAARDTLATETRVLRINYASADSVASVLRELATPDRGQVVAYGEANSVIVTDRPQVVSRMDSLVGSLDRRTPQVSIEAKIIFVDRTNVNALGIVYDLKDLSRETGFTEVIPTEGIEPGQQGEQGGGGQQQQQQRQFPYTVDFGGSSIASLANANDRVASPSLRILANTVFGGFSLTAFLDALRSQQLSDVEAAPSIQVLDNHSAYVQVGERTPIRVLESGAQLEEAQVNVQFEDTGIIMEVTPHITNNNQVLIDLRAERSGLQLGLSDVGFNFTRQVGETRLLLDDGETGAIAGLTLTEVSRSESGIPILMDLPLIGGLFRTTRSNERKQDLIILVTPHIVESDLYGAGPTS
jgi:type IV pilus assembly protein PilQ